MACENDKCDKYGMHHDFKDGVEVRKCEFCSRDERLINNKSIAIGSMKTTMPKFNYIIKKQG